ncbi:MAG: gamma-glutamyl-gamma-aminobutyrate hydrolase family protein, partial [Gammaproteobacteria bacterium]|nr:gamma-glutamyl-gamma-aminobutyrate hydrolase family protein [Gammaproteobacteria bacterium]
QEINVALGGSLHQFVHREKDFMDHREDKSLPLDAQYAPVHPVTLKRDGVLYAALQKRTLMVNSLHQQGINRLANSLQTECVADDGLIEGFSLRDRRRFMLGVQWHPEWQVMSNPDYQKIFDCFARACWQHKTDRPASHAD